MLIRAALRDGVRADGVRRLLHPRENDPAVFRPAARVYLPVDIDSLPLPAGTAPTDLTTCARAALAVLPPEFQAADCAAQFSGSHGVKPGIRVRLWFQTSRPVHCAEAKNWLRNSPVDPAAFGPVQPIYVTPPIFPEGAHDPLAHRFIWLRGERRTVAVPDDLSAASNVVRLHAAAAQSGGGDAQSAESLACAPTLAARIALKDILRQIPNGPDFNSRTGADSWLTMAHAITAAFPRRKHEPAAKKLFLEFCARRVDANGQPAKRDPVKDEAAWNSLRGPHKAGVKWILGIARKYGIDTSQYETAAHAARLAVAQAEFQATEEPPKGWVEAQDRAAASGKADDDDTDDLKAIRDQAINAVLDVGVTFWRDPDHVAYANVPHAGAVQRYRVRSGAFGRVVRRLYGSANPVRTKHGSRPGSLPDAVITNQTLKYVSLIRSRRIANIGGLEEGSHLRGAPL